MTKQQLVGKCILSGETTHRSAMTSHIAACCQSARVAKPLASGKNVPIAPAFHLFVAGQHEKDYWMHIAAPAGVTLRVLDSFLRRTWLECCGHMSAFEIEGERYSCSAMPGERNMKPRLAETLATGMKFSYEYDFGSTTELALSVVELRELALPNSRVQLLARNEAPTTVCQACGARPATEVCAQCASDGDGWYCDACARKHECGEEMFLPVVNSPRVGVCAYAG